MRPPVCLPGEAHDSGVGQVWVYPYLMATVNVPLTVPPNPAQFKNSENTIASARQLAGTPVLAVTFIEFDKCWPVGCKTFP